MTKHQIKQLSVHGFFHLFLSILLLLISTEAFAQQEEVLTHLLRAPDQPEEESSSHIASTTTRVGVFRFVTAASFPFSGIQINGGDALVGDDAVGFEVNITNAQDREGWLWKFFNPNGVLVVVSELIFFADGADLGLPGQKNCFFFFGDPFATCGSKSLTSAISAIVSRCSILGLFRIDLERIIPPDRRARELLFSETFTLVPTGPGTPQVLLNPFFINPSVDGGGGPPLPRIEAGETTVTVTVTDSDCPNIPLEKAKVTFSSKTVPGSGGHKHMGEQEGTGEFTLGIKSGKTVFEDTDLNGKVEATYTAGVAGLLENIEAVAEFNMIGIPPIAKKSEKGKRILFIAIQFARPVAGITFDLRPLPPSPADYIQKQSAKGEAAHPQNNFGTRDVIENRLPFIAQKFRDERRMGNGKMGLLSFNDLSLPFGGVFDLNLQLNDAGDHKSHEIGVDVDINKVNLTDAEVDALTLIALRKNCDFVHAVHYRCSRPLKK